MQATNFNLKPLRTLGIFLACGALAVGCADNNVKPMSSDTGAVSSAQVSDASAPSSDTITSVQASTESSTGVTNNSASPVSDNVKASTAQADTTTNVAASSSPPPDTSQSIAAIQEPTQKTFYFGVNKATLGDQDKAVLEQHARFLIANPDLVLEINGHTDSTGSHVYNEYLSKRRAEAVAKVLLGDGVTQSQLVVNALADTKPLSETSDPAKNRRVELQYDDINTVSTQ